MQSLYYFYFMSKCYNPNNDQFGNPKHGKFDRSKLELVKWKYAVTHRSAGAFKVGEVVFFKASPGIPLTVTFIDREDNLIGISVQGWTFPLELPPEYFLQYRFAMFKKYYADENLVICLN